MRTRKTKKGVRVKLLVFVGVLGICPLAMADAINVRSTFDAGLDGWTSVGSGDLTYMNQGGNPGGFVYWYDVPDQVHPGEGNGWLVAPPKFLGDWSALDGKGTLSWDHIILRTGTDPNCHFPPMGHYVVIVGEGGWEVGGQAVCRPSKSRMSSTWKRFSVLIDEVDWYVSPTSGRTWKDIISNVETLMIRIEGVWDDCWPTDIDGIDNVVLNEGHTLRADLNYDGIVNFEDFAIMAEEWLEVELWY